MADVSIDSIQLQIESDSSDAEKSVERLATSLMGLNKSLMKVSYNARSIRNLANSLAALNDIKITDLSGLISQLKKLSAIKADGLSKNVKLNVDDSGIDKLDRIKDKLQEVFNGLKDLKLNQTGINGVLNSISKIADADLSKFDQNSFNGIVDGLKKYSSLKDTDFKSTGISSFTNTLTKLTKLDTAKASSELGNLKNSLSGFKDIDMKSTGIASMINASVKLSEADFSNFNPKIFKTMAMSMKSLSAIGGKTADSVKVVTQFASAFSRLLNATQDMSDVDDRLSQFANSLQSFFATLSDIPQVNDSILRMTEALAQLSKGADRAKESLSRYRASSKATALSTAIVNSAFESVSATFKTFSDVLKKFTKFAYINPMKNLVNISKELGSKGVEGIKKFISKIKELNTAGMSFKSFGEKLREILGLLVGIRGITGVFNWVKDATKAGADVAETNHIIESTFGDLSEQVNNWAKDAIETYGIAQTSAKRYAGTLSAMFQSSGIGYKEAAQMSMDLVGMAGDLSSFYNVDTATVFQKLKSGMAGMVRPLRDFGIDLSVASLNEFALAQNMGKTYAQMTQAEKTMLRYEYLLNVTKTQQGDFARTSDKLKSVA